MFNVFDAHHVNYNVTFPGNTLRECM